jgi:hypothetical protein
MESTAKRTRTGHGGRNYSLNEKSFVCDRYCRKSDGPGRTIEGEHSRYSTTPAIVGCGKAIVRALG